LNEAALFEETGAVVKIVSSQKLKPLLVNFDFPNP